MKKTFAIAALLLTSSAHAAAVKTYQVTGPVVDVNDKSITVQKGSEKWEIARDADTKVTGDVKKGDKATVQYRMTAVSIEAKAGKAEKK
jgi:hypothetical protein